jgi:hypothetical protein
MQVETQVGFKLFDANLQLPTWGHYLRLDESLDMCHFQLTSFPCRHWIIPCLLVFFFSGVQIMCHFVLLYFDCRFMVLTNWIFSQYFCEVSRKHLCFRESVSALLAWRKWVGGRQGLDRLDNEGDPPLQASNIATFWGQGDTECGFT